MEAQILQPVIVLVAWTLLILLWMLATRIPYSIKNNISPQEGAHATDISSKLPSGVRQIIENYNHLHEQPTIFYVVALVLALLGSADVTQVMLAWVYVGSRIIHSIIQCTYNSVMHRFLLFLVGSLALAGMVAIEVSGWTISVT
ncbi:MAG: hypothetical protein CMQ40_04000 [Gammaproteobacteria bacterium]|nr:hypothetical protein [Gammaproteobacteria bacterium]|tara:strand:- start:194 stop:625 length:432 start_codon:yes stop_codon:yes gene_type:complete